MMTLSQIQRRALLAGFAAVLVILAAVACYWHGVRKGTLPSPMASMAQPLPVHAPPVTVAARPRVDLVPPRPPAKELPSIVAPAPSRLEKREAGAPQAEVAEQPAERSVSEPVRSVAKAIPKVPEAVPRIARVLAGEPQSNPSREEALAAEWLSRTNDRPVIRIHYNASEILRLVQAGRGLIVASQDDGVGSRELYWQPSSEAAPLLVPYTASLGARYSNYSLRLQTAPELGALTSVLPLYFSGKPVALRFIPDEKLAQEIFVRVARVSSSVTAALKGAGAPIYEGGLSARGQEPEFDLWEARAGATRFALSSSGDARD